MNNYSRRSRIENLSLPAYSVFISKSRILGSAGGIMNGNESMLVVGGTGKTGRRVAERLRRLGLPLRVGSRSARPAFDWEDRKTWSPTLDGIRQAYVTYFPDICVPGAVETVRSFFAQAVDTGRQQLVFLSC